MTRRLHLAALLALLALPAYSQPAATNHQTVSSQLGGGQFIDRLLVNVDSRHYGQRQFELYMALESLLFKAKPGRRWQVDATNWEPRLATYVNHMLVDNAARSLATFNARPNEIDVAEKKIARIKDGSWQRFISRLGFAKAAVAAERDRLIRVAKFVCHRLKLSGAGKRAVSSGCKDGEALPSLSKDYAWFARIVKETPYRVYEGAKNYQPILPYPRQR